MGGINYDERIPNNVELSTNKTLQRALEHWQPRFLDWWKDLGPEVFQNNDVYLRTATSVDAQGWATFGMVRMPEYRWGIFLADPKANRTIGFGDNIGAPAWQVVPGEHRSTLRRLIVTQGDTEPASVEQQRALGKTAPSLYDLRNLFQVNVEEGRHLWAMVYLLHAYFGRDGREEAEGLLERHAGDADKPRILTTFNEPIRDWLSFYMFAYFTDRDGKFQLKALAESGFDPLARTCQFMLTEEAHHMFVGDSGIGRVVRRTVEVMNELKTEDPQKIRAAGAIDLQTIQKYMNFWFSSALDLFGSEVSSNAASYFANGLKGRPDESLYDDHVANGDYTLDLPDGRGGVKAETVSMRNAMNEVMRAAYIRDCENGVKRWNKIIEKGGVDFELRLPSARFRRTVGAWSNVPTDPAGNPIAPEAFAAGMPSWIPTPDDQEFVQSMMQPVLEPGKVASWIAAPERGINNLPVDYEYVRVA
ncbi:MAG: benzoyl-CoA 2,3-epoxidase subunit BoxB [Acidobacteria bacterium]|nr:benzoyl-CoA 2,3-epoxidase subunit BoxB [Acidobacteriota bacterium]MBV9476195.1 benzoyl-CoA 2,3-epoxidase subunit BoxB [Acidobacteriota bacterium]